MAEIQTHDLTEATLAGGGVFDELMRATKAHLDEEFAKNRIRGPEYSQVYLGSMQAVMQYGVQFLLERQQSDQQAELIKAQILTEQKQQALLDQQLLNAQAEKLAIEADTLQAQAQTAQIEQQTINLEAEALNIPKQGAVLDAQVDQTTAQTALIGQQKLNAIKENEMMDKQICKLEAEYDVLMEQKLKTVAETALLTQKKATEKAQIQGTGVDADSVLGRQKGLYLAQAEGFKRDAEQKAAKVLVDTWNVRRTTDEGVEANVTNRLDDATIGQTIQKLLEGLNA